MNFRDKHPSCGYVTCCVIKREFEVCSDCNEYPCSRFDGERKGFGSFVTHRKVFYNLDYIKSNGIESFVEQQKSRMDILTDFLDEFDDGRSKSFFCLSCTLLPLDKLQETEQHMSDFKDLTKIKEKNKLIKKKLLTVAENINIILKLNNKKY